MKIESTRLQTAQAEPLSKNEVLSLPSADVLAKRDASVSSGQNVVMGGKLNLPQGSVTKVNDALSESGSSLQFQLDQDAHKMVLYLKDSKTGEVLRQFPDKEALQISQQITEYLDAVKNRSASRGDALGKLSGMIMNTNA